MNDSTRSAGPGATASRQAIVLAAIAAVLATLLPSGTSAAATEQVILRATRTTRAAVQRLVANGGQVVAELPELDIVIGRAPASSIGVLERDPEVASVTLDRPYEMQGKKKDDDLGAPSRTAARTVAADRAWAQGFTGEGVGVAVVDTGISNSLDDRLAVGINVSSDQQRKDGYGHGTFMAGLVTGDLGVAPDAHLVSVKIADRDGRTSLSDVLQGLAAALDARDDFGVRVVLLALGREPDGESDVLESALEQLWAQGLVVVVPTGNDTTQVMSPGRNPYLLTVGALDDRGTADHRDDRVPSWSASTGGKPDVVAPGVSLVSLRAPGSSIDRDSSQARLPNQQFRGSGTSMAAAVTAGAAAVLLEAHPELTPDEVKGRLVASAAAGPSGTRVLDVASAIASAAPPANRGLSPIATVAPDQADEVFPGWQGSHWAGSHWAGSHWAGSHWAGSHWAGSHWAGSHWAGSHWAGSHWAGSHWAGSHWAGAEWK